MFYNFPAFLSNLGKSSEITSSCISRLFFLIIHVPDTDPIASTVALPAATDLDVIISVFSM